MARGINKAIIVGSVGKDPDVRYTSSGAAVANISVATNEQWKDKQTGEKQERTEWHRISAFGRLAEIIGEYVNKGQQIYIEGKIQTRKWQDKDGQDRYTTEIVANEMQMLGGNPNSGNVGNSGNSGHSGGGVSNSPTAGRPNNHEPSPTTGGNFDDFELDPIPF